MVFGVHMELIEAIEHPAVSLASMGRLVKLPYGILKVGPLGPGSIAVSLVILMAPFDGQDEQQAITAHTCYGIRNHQFSWNHKNR